ncbi:hypothetical protein O181_020018 [Austropuccinia psidii MF-1]|uniref:Reverse transcriptase Ty1/copia-type domain-containing protein n=1 Tax=Austropuccinia psidii MF-1 TaxID=1389203 RepID=A0A9Q3CAP0_9BASI|nr:hypothetical protein [Austropuccinia psidii MF-1]
MWQLKLVSILEKCGMHKSRSDDSLFLNKDLSLILHVHVDDGFFIGKEELILQDLLKKLSKELTVKSKRQPTQHLGYMITWHKDGSLGLSQSDLIRKLLYDNDMSDSKGVKTPCNGNFHMEIDNEGEVIAITAYQRAIGSLNYLAQHTQPDTIFTVNQLSRYSIKPTIRHWTAIKHLMRYLEATINLSLTFSKCTNKTLLKGWVDADYANDRTDRKSITGILTSVYGNPISWLKMGIEDSKPALYNDNYGATTIAKQATLNPNTKHIEIRFQYLRDIVLKRQLTIVQVGTDDILADVLTKPLGVQKLTTVYPQIHLKEIRGVLRKESPFEDNYEKSSLEEG